MQQYILKDNNGRFIMMDCNGKYRTTECESLADVFQSPKAANSALHQLPRGFRTVFFVSPLSEEVKCIETNSSIPECVSLWVEQVRVLEENIKSVRNLQSRAESREKELQTYLSELDRDVENLKHEIELGRNLDLVSGYAMYKELRETLRKRRLVKDELMIVGEVKKANIGHNAVGDLGNKANGLANRKYTYR